ncbi:MAG: DUF6702 family protein [Bacteroidota bacterium]
MTLKLHYILLLIASMFFSSPTEQSVAHPIKLTSSEIKYDAKTKSIQMRCNVFIDDFTPVINPTLFIRAKQESLTEEDKKGIEQYFQQKYRIYINNRQLSLSFEDYTIKENVMTIAFSENYAELKKGDEIYIENELLFEEFDYQQSNWISFNMPPFLLNKNFESKMDNSTYSHEF